MPHTRGNGEQVETIPAGKDEQSVSENPNLTSILFDEFHTLEL